MSAPSLCHPRPCRYREMSPTRPSTKPPAHTAQRPDPGNSGVNETLPIQFPGALHQPEGPQPLKLESPGQIHLKQVFPLISLIEKGI